MFLRRFICRIEPFQKLSSDTKSPATIGKKSKDLEGESKKSTAVECIKETQLVPQTKPAYAPLKRVKVAVIGAFSFANATLCAMLKMNPLVKEIRMYDEINLLLGTCLDIRQINTSAKLIPFIGLHQLKNALARADIVVVTAHAEPNDTPNSQIVFSANAERTKFLAQQCIANCPDAVFVLTSYPVNSTVPLFSEVFLQHGVLCPNRIIGSMALDSMRIRTMAATSLGLDPASIQVDVIGGGTPQTVVPIISGARPGGVYLKNEFRKLHEKLTEMSREVLLNKQQPPSFSIGYAVSQLVSNVAKGLCGKPHPPTSVFLRTSALYGVKYLSVPVQFGLSGVEKNYGIPPLSSLEIEALDGVLCIIKEDIARGEHYAQLKQIRNYYVPEPADDDECIPTTLPRCFY